MSRSEQLFQQARQHIPGGVNSPVRAFKAVGGTPRFIERAEGAYVFDVDGKRYIDYVLSWGPMLLGHAHPSVITAVTEQGTHVPTLGRVEGFDSNHVQRWEHRVSNDGRVTRT